MSTDKFQNKYRIPSARWREWDYGSNGGYFVTICTKDKIHYFGKIIENQMQLTPIGKTAEQYWREIPKHFPFVKLDSFVIMPNHIHGIIVIDKMDNAVETQYFASPNDGTNEFTETQYFAPPNDGTNEFTETQYFASLQQQPPNKFGPQSQNLSSIIRGFKAAVKKYAVINHIDFTWQSRFHDRVIRDHYEYERIVHYIEMNIENWNCDDLFE